VLYYQVPDYSEMSFVHAFLRPGELFVDVGANVGVYSLWASEVHDVHSVAFEPSSATYARVAENVALNGLIDRVHLMRMAVGAEKAVVRFSTGLDATNRVLSDGTGTAESVQQTTLDDVFTDQEGLSTGVCGRAPALIKIDVEGQEANVLRGASSLIARHRPALIVEVNDPERLADLFAEFGYTAWSYDPKSRRLSPVATMRHIDNVIAIADIGEARRRIATGAGPTQDFGHRSPVELREPPESW